jgi:hypothetical protein
VLIVCGGPRLILANEFGRRGVAAVLVGQKPGTALFAHVTGRLL